MFLLLLYLSRVRILLYKHNTTKHQHTCVYLACLIILRPSHNDNYNHFSKRCMRDVFFCKYGWNIMFLLKYIWSVCVIGKAYLWLEEEESRVREVQVCAGL